MLTSQLPYTAEEIGIKGRTLYKEEIQSQVEPAYMDKFLSLDIETGDYEVGDDILTTKMRLQERLPNAVMFTVRVGHRAAVRIGGRSFSRKRKS